MNRSSSPSIAHLALFTLVAMLSVGSAESQIVEHRLTASDGTQSFGEDVSISGDRAIIGAPLDDDSGDNSGSAYVFERQSDGSWIETDKLTASDAFTEQRFGQSVAISGDYAIIGVLVDNDAGSNAGAAYIFQRQGNGSWLELEKLTASDAATLAQFGFKVSLLGSRALIGAPGDDDHGAGSGSMYIFEQQGDGSWIEVEKLTASDGNAGANLGISVSLSDGRALGGAAHDPGGTSVGAAYVFERQGDGTWPEMAKLAASDGSIGDIFGISVAISGDYALAGASNSSPQGNRSGSAYAFERQGDGSWIETDKILPSDGVELDFFGFGAAAEGDYAAIGAYAVATDGTRGDGAVYTFERQSNGTWMELDKLVASDGMSGFLGITLAISNGRVLAGASASEGGGAAYLYENVFPVALEPTPGASAGFHLSDIYPNPVSGEARFSLEVMQPQLVRIEVFNVLGRRHAVLHEGPITTRTAKDFLFDTGSLPNGIYLLRFTGESFVTTRTMTVSR